MKYLLKRQFSDNSNIFRSLLSIYGIGYIKALLFVIDLEFIRQMCFKDLNQQSFSLFKYTFK